MKLQRSAMQGPGQMSGASRLRGILSVLFALAFLVSVGVLTARLWEYRRSAEEYGRAESLAGLAEPDPLPVPPPGPEPTVTGPEPEPPDDDALAHVDLDALRAENPDVAGWLLIPGTEVSYPLLQSRDNAYYLRRSWTGRRSTAGSLFLDFRCSADLSDFNTIVYGHRMRDGSMFAPLLHYNRQDYWEEHPAVYLATQGGTFRGEIFAAYETEITGSPYRTGRLSGADRPAFLEDALARSVLDTGITPGPQDHVLTLSTCTASGSRRTRWVVQAVLFKEKERPAQKRAGLAGLYSTSKRFRNAS